MQKKQKKSNLCVNTILNDNLINNNDDDHYGHKYIIVSYTTDTMRH